MSPRAAAWLAWAMCGLTLALTALSLFLLALNLSRPNPHVFDLWVQGTVIAVSCSVVGVLVASRRPDHPIGWLFCTVALLVGVNHFGGEYAVYALLTRSDSLPGDQASAWIASWIWVPVNVLLLFVVLLFPDGQLPSRRWRPFAWLNVVVAVAGIVAVALLPGPIATLGTIENPLGLEGAANLLGPVAIVSSALERGILALVALASLFLRLHRAGREERQQIKWFAYAASVAVVGAILTYVVSEATGTRWVGQLGLALLVAGFVGFPITIGIAILRYRLYDIDRLINRTLVYGSLTAALALLYFGSVVVMQAAFHAFTSGNSQLTVVASTLGIAALFNPLRKRIQSFIDRRFYLKKYDAAKTLEAFSATLRDETDLERLSEGLTSVVRETLEPRQATLWLRAPDRRVRR